MNSLRQQNVTLLEQRLDTEASRHREELVAITERSERLQDRHEKALAELRLETEARAKAETLAQTAEHRVEELKGELTGKDRNAGRVIASKVRPCFSP